MNKPLTLAAVAALLMAGGQQVAAQASTFCPPVALVGHIEATPGFSCTINSPFGAATVSDFSFFPLLKIPDNYALYFQGTPVDVVDAGFSLTLQPFGQGVRLPAGDVPDLFNYQMSISNISGSVLPPGMVSTSLTLAAGPVFAPPPPVTGTVTATTNVVGNVVGSNTLTAVAEGRFGHGTDVATLDGDTTFKVSNSLSTTPIPPSPATPYSGFILSINSREKFTSRCRSRQHSRFSRSRFSWAP
jgi:hypothetical protein